MMIEVLTEEQGKTFRKATDGYDFIPSGQEEAVKDFFSNSGLKIEFVGNCLGDPEHMVLSNLKGEKIILSAIEICGSPSELRIGMLPS